MLLQLKLLKTIVLILLFLILLFCIVKIINSSITKNISISEPVGYYLKLPMVNKIKRSDKYLICLTNSKYIAILKHLGLPNATNQCPDNSPYLIKQVAGIPYDVIRITKSGVLINGILQPNSIAFKSARGINLFPIPAGYQVVLGHDDYFMLGVTPHSVDSRYFGIIHRNQFYKQTILILKDNSL